mmetsp:Transcript_49568/g.113523  ORF Transcript_49568/g.113523 Transcript_49568/m.113523 type:complete len:265 (-) Transcript_49568:717-1511(-)
MAAVSMQCTDSAANERASVALDALHKKGQVAFHLGEHMSLQLPSDGSARAFAALKTQPDGGVNLTLKVFCLPSEVDIDLLDEESAEQLAEVDRARASALIALQHAMGAWHAANISSAALASLGEMIWINCLMHATVHGVDGFMDALNEKLVAALGEDEMAVLRGLQTGTSAKSAEHKKQKHNLIWLEKAPLNHFIYQLTKVFAACAKMDWSHATRFCEFVIAKKLLRHGETHVLAGIQRVKGNRNAALAMNCLGILRIWDRAIS